MAQGLVRDGWTWTEGHPSGTLPDDWNEAVEVVRENIVASKVTPYEAMILKLPLGVKAQLWDSFTKAFPEEALAFAELHFDN